jgi:hypothetical protein
MPLSKSNIETLTHRWNPVTGCSGTGCSCKEHCWAARPFRGHTPDMTVQFHPEKVHDPIIEEKRRNGEELTEDEEKIVKRNLRTKKTAAYKKRRKERRRDAS